MAELRIKEMEESDIDTILAEDIDFTGDLSFTRPLMIKGKLMGAVSATGDLYVGEDADVDATIEANIVSLKGRLHGNISAATRVELFSTAVMNGDITSPDVVMESGCRFNGSCNMQSTGDGEDG